MSTTTSKGPQSFPYDHLFKLLMIGDAAVGKVSNIYHKYCAYHIAILYVLQSATQNLINVLLYFIYNIMFGLTNNTLLYSYLHYII